MLSREAGLIIDPFGGSGSTGIAALKNNRNCLIVDNNHEYCQIAHTRLTNEVADLYNQVNFFNPQDEYQSVVNELKEGYHPKKKAKK